MNIPIETTFRNGNTVRTTVDQFNLTSYLMKLDMDQVVGIKYGKDVPPLATEVRLSNTDIHQSRDRSTMDLTFFDKDDKQAAYIKSTPAKVQEFALRLLQQTTYAFEDLVNR